MSGAFASVRQFQPSPSLDTIDLALNYLLKRRAAETEFHPTVSPNRRIDEIIQVREWYDNMYFRPMRLVHHIVKSKGCVPH